MSGYRSPRSNELLRSRSGAVARHSLHLKAMAADVRLAGVPLTRLRDAALDLRKGGVGYYAGEFVHVDTGRVRKLVARGSRDAAPKDREFFAEGQEGAAS